MVVVAWKEAGFVVTASPALRACGSVGALRAGCLPGASPQASILSHLQRLDCQAGGGWVSSLHPYPDHDDETVMIGAQPLCGGCDRATRPPAEVVATYYGSAE